MIVRTIQPHEFDPTIILFNYYRDEAIEAIPQIADEYDENSMMTTIKQYVVDHHYCWFNAFEGQRPVGFISGYMSQVPWNNQLVVANISFVFLLESHRTLDNFKMLMQKFEEWARTIKAYQITGGDIGINIERSSKLYEHFGFRPFLTTIKELES
jgi:GNAT superfamily N-acetyltransferase